MQRPARRAVVIATAAALGLTGLVAPAANAATPTDLFISEYIEGSSFNKAIEIYNPTGSEVDLAAGGYALQVYFNGSSTATSAGTFALTGSIAAGDVYVFADEDLASYADQTTNSSLFNGDDAVALVKDGTILDVIGQIGFDPGSRWGADPTSTQDNTLRRNANICVGDPDGTDVFDPTVEWTGYPQNTFDGLGSHTAECGTAEPSAVINEFVANHTGTDTNEYIEILAGPGIEAASLAVLQIEGDWNTSPTPPMGLVDSVTTFAALDADGRAVAQPGGNGLENGTMTLLLVTGDIPAAGTDIDADNDGVIDDGFGFTILDSVAVSDGGADDLTYSDIVLTQDLAGGFTVGGASRIPDGVDTDSASDWTVNDFDGAGLVGFSGSIADGEAYNTPGAANEVYVAPPPPVDVLPIGTVQGQTGTSPYVGQTVVVEGIVVGEFLDGLDGFYVQDAGDGDAATSDGIFVYSSADVAVGDAVTVTGPVSEYFGLTEISADEVVVTANDVDLPAAAALNLPLTEAQREAHEGMLVTLPQTLSILEFYNFGRYGQIVAGLDRQMTPTAVLEPGSPEAAALLEQNLAERITIDDGRSSQNPDPAIHPNGEEFTLDNSFRGGDHLTNVTGILDYRFSTWAVQPTMGAEYESVNARPEVPEVGGSLTVSSFNVLNYFTTIDPTPGSSSDDDYTRGADTEAELERQQAKIVAALAEIDADVFGLIEIENSGVDGFEIPNGGDTGEANEALATLTAALNAEIGEDAYDYIATGPVGTDAITTALVYKTATVEPVGDFALLTESVDERWSDEKNRPALAQTFADAESGAEVTVVVNHLKSKGSSCSDIGDVDQGDGAGNCNLTRTLAAEAMVDWLAGDPTGQGAGRELVIGDLNSYDKEDPIDALVAGGYTDLLLDFQGEEAYSYVFDGQLGYLDYALAGTALAPAVTGAAAWHINADEPSLIDYDMSFKLDAQDALWAPDPYRSSDHDPVIVGIDTTPPTIEVTATPAIIALPNTAQHAVEVTVEAADETSEVTVEFVDATASGTPQAEVEQVDDTTFLVRAYNKAVYTFTYVATDEAGNSAIASAVVEVVPPKGGRMMR